MHVFDRNSFVTTTAEARLTELIKVPSSEKWNVMLSWRKKSADLGHYDPVRILQDVILGMTSLRAEQLATALGTILQTRLWERRDGVRWVFASFAEFVIAPAPAGLGIRTTPPLKLIRRALVQGRYYAEWTELLKLVMRRPGRPPTTLVNDEGFLPFYTLSTAKTAVDRLLLALERDYPDHFAHVCAGDCTPYAAAVRAGVINRARASRRARGFDIEALRKLGEAHKREILRDVFRAVGFNAQCSLLALDIGPPLEMDLAGRWRELGKR